MRESTMNRMRHTKIAILLLFLCTPILLGAQESTTPRWAYNHLKASRSADGTKLVLSLDIEPLRNSLGAQEVAILSPRIVSADGTQEVDLGTYYIAGALRMKALKRAVSLKQELPAGIPMSEVKTLRDVAKSPIHIERTVPFEYWMSNAKIRIAEKAFGCVDCEAYSITGTKDFVDINLFGPVDYKYYDYEPFKVEQKSYEEEMVSRVEFRVARSELLRDFANNASEIDRINDFISKALKLADSGATIGDVYIGGYASPEGEFNSNLTLSQARSEVLAKMIEEKYPKLRKTARFEIKGNGEDWQGLREALVASSYSYAKDVVAIIDRYSTDLEREKDIKAMEGGRVYNELLQNVYPPLRRTVFKMRYDVRPYTVDELPGIYKSKPELLSAWELYQLAQVHYIAKGLNPTSVYATAHRIYPKDRDMALNYVTSLLKYDQNANQALSILATLQEDGTVLFLKAIAENMKGDMPTADQLLHKAAKAGNADAKRAIERQ